MSVDLFVRFSCSRSFVSHFHCSETGNRRHRPFSLSSTHPGSVQMKKAHLNHTVHRHTRMQSSLSLSIQRFTFISLLSHCIFKRLAHCKWRACWGDDKGVRCKIRATKSWKSQMKGEMQVERESVWTAQREDNRRRRCMSFYRRLSHTFCSRDFFCITTFSGWERETSTLASTSVNSRY